MTTSSDTKVIEVLQQAKADSKRVVAVKRTPEKRNSNIRFLRANTANVWNPGNNDGPEAA